MARYGRDRGRIEADQTKAKSHPIRKKILALFTRDTLRPLDCDLLSADLLAEYPDVKPDEAEPGQINYHLAVLKDAQLLPG
jgi:hypothetical protein